MAPSPSVELLEKFAPGELNDLCDATYAAIESGGGFGWTRKPERDVLERYWQGVLAMPARLLFVARLDNMICGTLQLVKPPVNNEAQRHIVQLTTNFVAPWARGHGLAKMLLEEAEKVAKEEG
ncbi:MAG: GNAT family N-acetyltransferase, partial [Alphaproteobacteria bacterium]|nr:GNAT family N-acetyltransferase [Alphaproteobacteria bacterium]